MQYNFNNVQKYHLIVYKLMIDKTVSVQFIIINTIPITKYKLPALKRKILGP